MKEKKSLDSLRIESFVTQLDARDNRKQTHGWVGGSPGTSMADDCFVRFREILTETDLNGGEPDMSRPIVGK